LGKKNDSSEGDACHTAQGGSPTGLGRTFCKRRSVMAEKTQLHSCQKTRGCTCLGKIINILKKGGENHGLAQGKEMSKPSPHAASKAVERGRRGGGTPNEKKSSDSRKGVRTSPCAKNMVYTFPKRKRQKGKEPIFRSPTGKIRRLTALY